MDSSGVKTGRCIRSLFSHSLDGYKTLKEGDEVEFDIVEGQKVPRRAVVRFKDSAHNAA